MVFTAEHALDLMERETYRHYLMAYDRVWYHETAKRKQVASAFVEAVRTKHPDIYEDYDPTSFMLHDFLQPVFIDVSMILMHPHPKNLQNDRGGRSSFGCSHTMCAPPRS